MTTEDRNGRLAFTVTWEVRAGEEEAASGIIARFVPLARHEPGLELLVVNQNAADPRKFLFYEIFRNQAGFDAHQQTPHFRKLILEDALPLLSHRERVQYVLL